MTKQCKDNYFILTGAMGGGKSTILKQLRKIGMMVIDEPARQILAEQRNIDGDGVPDKDKKLFTDLLLSRSMFQFHQMQDYQGPVIFDRGIPDNIAYASFFNLDTHTLRLAADKYRYNPLVFFTPAWKDIYENDAERKMSFAQANKFGDNVKDIYARLGYKIINVPFVDPSQRVDFIVKNMGC